LLNGVGRIGESGLGTGIKTSDLGCAARCALNCLNPKKVLRTLHGITTEGNVDRVPAGDRCRNRAFSARCGSNQTTTDGDTIDYLIGKVEEGLLDVVKHIGFLIGSGDVGEDNRDSGEGFAKLRLESEGKSLSNERGCPTISCCEGCIGIIEVRNKDQLLNLVIICNPKVVALVENISDIRAHALGAINIAIEGVTNAASVLVLIPAVVLGGHRSHRMFGRIEPGSLLGD
jgi:hypothetical protein